MCVSNPFKCHIVEEIQITFGLGEEGEGVALWTPELEQFCIGCACFPEITLVAN